MSTPAIIVVKVNEKDLGKRRKCDASKINLRTHQMAFDMWKALGHSDEEIEEIIDKCDKVPDMEFLKKNIKSVKLRQFISVCHNWDGYPDGLGKELLNRFNDYDSALNLVLAGDFSTILDGSAPYASILYDSLPKRTDLVWEKNKPSVSDELEDCYMNYQYLFDNGRWYYRGFGDKKFKILR